ncbi:MAG: DUF3822 family protein [Saprospiraceae bacterium]
MITFDITSKEDKYQNKNNKLSLLISGDNFLFIVYSSILKKVYSLRDLSGIDINSTSGIYELKSFIKTNGYNELNQLNIYTTTPEFGLTPMDFKDINANEVLDPITIKHYLDEYKVIQNPVSSFQLNCHFVFPEKLFDLFSNLFENVNLNHQITLLLNSLNISQDTTSGFVICNFSPGNIQLISIKNNQLAIAKTYNLKSKDDMLYYILKMYHSSGLLPNINPLILSGRIEKESVIYSELQNYIKHINFAEIDIENNFSTDFIDSFQSHYFYDIYHSNQ